jgi:hypothetical protein
MSTLTQTDSMDALLAAPPYGLPAKEKRALLLAALNDAYRHHFGACVAYRRYCERRGFMADQVFADITELPYLPVQAFKENAGLLRSVDAAQITTRLSSSATSGVASSVDIDKVTAKRQVRALASVIGEVLGQKRRPFLVLDVDPRMVGLGGLGARSAAVRGFLNLAREARYFMDVEAGGLLTLKEGDFAAALALHSAGNEPVAVFGFTYVLYAHAVLPLLKAGRSFRLPPGSRIVHIGGWKKLADQQVSKVEFNYTMERVFGVPASHVVDFYGFTEQMGVTYPDGPEGSKFAPAFADVIVRDPSTFKPLPDGHEGLLEFVTPLPYSYPGIAVLTDDVGVVTERDATVGAWHGTRFQIIGRAKKAEVRGCGDIMSEKVVKPGARHTERSVGASTDIRLLCGPSDNHVAGDLFSPVALEQLPAVPNLDELAVQLREGREKLDAYSIDDLIALVAGAAKRWADPNSPLVPLRQQGLLFLTSWCEAGGLRTMADRSLHGQRGFMDGFRALAGSNRRLMRAQPRGLVAHWLAGNVPLLGMLALAQSIVTRNANILKAASSFSRVLPALLDGFRGLKVRCVDGRILNGDDVLASIAVVYFPREHSAAAEQMSALADVRLAWGGREAIESILNLPKRYGTEDVIFGPKLSFMAVGREALANPRLLRRAARQAATDTSVFDQYACASPHTIFVEKGGVTAPREFAAALAVEMAKALIRIPKGPVDAGTAAKVESLRMRYEFTGELWRSGGTEWTVLYDEAAGKGLAEPCYSRVITVRAIDDILEAAQFAHKGIQTVGTALSGSRKLAFASAASARGVERFPDLGRMTFFDSPWDGLFPMDRLVKWVTLGGPF